MLRPLTRYLSMNTKAALKSKLNNNILDFSPQKKKNDRAGKKLKLLASPQFTPNKP